MPAAHALGAGSSATVQGMSLRAIMGAIALLTAVLVGLRARAQLRRLRRGDLVRVPIPRTLAGPLSTGTRLDAGAALKKAGMPIHEVRALTNGDHDQELLDRYWALIDGGDSASGSESA